VKRGLQILGLLAALAALIWSLAHASVWAGVLSFNTAALFLLFLVTEGIESAADEEDYY
jgi:membrane protein implicated in regulation of membrane protease activity